MSDPLFGSHFDDFDFCRCGCAANNRQKIAGLRTENERLRADTVHYMKLAAEIATENKRLQAWLLRIGDVGGQQVNDMVCLAIHSSATVESEGEKGCG